MEGRSMRSSGTGGATESRKKVVLGILAHVDAGKTTLAEGILYLSGKLRKLGRVDHKDAFLDTYELERARGITIFSKQALVTLGDLEVTLLDTPGHVDFSAEMERTLQVLDMAILVISGADGVQGHVETLWRLLKRYRVPVFLFINKMDQAGTDAVRLLHEVQERLDERCVDFGRTGQDGDWLENLAMCQEGLMEEYLESGRIGLESVRRAIAHREVFPCFFGSALKLTGVVEFLEGIQTYLEVPGRGTEGKHSSPVGLQKGNGDMGGKSAESFGARVYKISRDSQGNRMTHMKITGGSLHVKSLVNGEKVNQIRVYNGASYQTADEAEEGMVCAILGPEATYSGQGLGFEREGALPLLEPVLTYQIQLPRDQDVVEALGWLRQLEEEIPELHIVWKETLREIHAQVMGEVQMEVLKSLILERFGLDVTFGSGSIVYKETIAAPVEGIGHFEPLRHYAEVHLLMEPGERGSGLQFGSSCSEDVLDRNWQRLILTHLEERQHVGVLTGAEITDMRITLVAGRAHLKHTEGGDFRQATYRAVRQGLMKASCVLLEPVYEFTLEVPTEAVGRAMTDVQKMQGSFESPITEGEVAFLKGKAPVVNMRGYQKEVVSYTHGRGRLTCVLAGYEPCHNQEEIVERLGYDPEADLDNPVGSVFCAHGAGFLVSWDQVDAFAHVDSGLRLEKHRKDKELPNGKNFPGGERFSIGAEHRSVAAEEAELEEIFTRTYGPIKRDRNLFQRNRGQELLESGGTARKREETTSGSPYVSYRSGAEKKEEYLLVDGYNIIFAWEDLRELSQVSIDGARTRLMDLLSNYQGFRKNTVILVFDAYKVKGNPGSVEKYHNIYVVYTKEAETADQYIEKTVNRIARKYQVTVATSDALEQVIIWGQGAIRMSAPGLREEIQNVNGQILEILSEKFPGTKNYPFRELGERMKQKRKGD